MLKTGVSAIVDTVGVLSEVVEAIVTLEKIGELEIAWEVVAGEETAEALAVSEDGDAIALG